MTDLEITDLWCTLVRDIGVENANKMQKLMTEVQKRTVHDMADELHDDSCDMHKEGRHPLIVAGWREASRRVHELADRENRD